MIDAPFWRLTNMKTPFDTVGPWLYEAVFSALALIEPSTCFGRIPSVPIDTRNGAYTPLVSICTVLLSSAVTALRCCFASPL